VGWSVKLLVRSWSGELLEGGEMSGIRMRIRSELERSMSVLELRLEKGLACED
jgi:hypothetical protein